MRDFKRAVAAMLIILLTITVFGANVSAAGQQAGGEYLQQVMDLIKQKYNGDISEEELIRAAVDAMFNNLDRYSDFYTQEEFDTIYSSYEGAVEGVGIQVLQGEEYVEVVKVFSGSPAQKAGVLPGDKIVEVDGRSVKDLPLEEVISKVKGIPGTQVKLGLQRQGADNTIVLRLERAKVDLPSVRYEIRGDIGYLHIDSFIANTAKEAAEALNFFDRKNISKVILDLRDNPGGLVDQAVDVAKLIVPKGLIATLDYKDPKMEDEKYYSELEKIKYKLAVLVNENSASAAEILTGAIKDTKAGVIVGAETYGKAKVQSFIPLLSPEGYQRLNNGSANKTVNALEVDAYESDLIGWAKVTIGMYYTPNGTCIDLQGIQPDIEVEYNEEEFPVNMIEPLTVTVKPKLGTQYLDVFYAECILQLLGYDINGPDMQFDDKTFKAVKQFQTDSGLYGYGVLDFSTQRILNEKLDLLKQTEDPAYVAAARAISN